MMLAPTPVISSPAQPSRSIHIVRCRSAGCSPRTWPPAPRRSVRLALHRRSAGGERLLNLVEVGRAWHAGEADACHLVKRGTRLGERGDPASNRYHEPIAAASAATGSPACLGDQLRLDTFHPLG